MFRLQYAAGVRQGCCQIIAAPANECFLRARDHGMSEGPFRRIFAVFGDMKAP